MVLQVTWTFSLYLEAVAILPQLVLLQRTRNIDNLTGQYVFLLGYFLLHNLCSFYLRSIRYFCMLQWEFFLPQFWILITIMLPYVNVVSLFIFLVLLGKLSTFITSCSAYLLHFKTPVNLVTLICCSAYRALYILNWVYRYFTEPHYVHWISMSSSVQSHVHLEAYPYKKNLLIFRCLNFIAAWIAGTVQTLLYADFFYYYFQRLVFKL
jgi:hypothetical protein